MGTAELRKEAHSFIERASDKVLEKVLAMDTESEKIVVVGYEADGTPITREELIQEVQEVSARVKAGNYITQEEMEKGVEGW